MQNYEWDVFFSYNWGTNNENKPKVKDAYDSMKDKLKVNIWLDQFQLQHGDLVKKIYDGISKSKLVVSFITRGYGNSASCMQELALSKNLGLPVLFFINEDTTNMSFQEILREIFKEAAWYLGSSLFYKTLDELLNATKLTLAEKRINEIKVKPQEQISVVLIFHQSLKADAQGLVAKLKETITANFISTETYGELDVQRIIYDSDMVLVFFNYDFAIDNKCKQEFFLARNHKHLIKLNFAPETNFSITLNKEIHIDKSIEFHEDTNKSFLKGTGNSFTKLRNLMETCLPRPLEEKKKTDLIIIGSEKAANRIKAIEKFRNLVMKVLKPKRNLEPDYKTINEAKVMVVIVNDELQSCDTSEKEIKYAKEKECPLFFVNERKKTLPPPQLQSVIEDNDVKNNISELNSVSTAKLSDEITECLNRLNAMAEILRQAYDTNRPFINKDKEVVNFLASGGLDNTIKIWNLAYFYCKATLYGHISNVTCLQLMGPERLVSGSEDNKIKIWDLNSFNNLETLYGHEEPVRCLQVLKQNRLASGSDDGVIKIWDLDSFEEIETLQEHDDSVQCLQMIDSNLLASGSEDNCIKIWDLNTFECLETFDAHDSNVQCLLLIESSLLASGSDDDTIKIWDLSDYSCLNVYRGHTESVRCLALIRTDLLASGSDDGTIKIWDLDNFECIKTLAEHSGPILCLKILKNNLFASGSNDSTIRIWDTNSLACINIMEGHDSFVSSLEFLS